MVTLIKVSPHKHVTIRMNISLGKVTCVCGGKVEERRRNQTLDEARFNTEVICKDCKVEYQIKSE